MIGVPARTGTNASGGTIDANNAGECSFPVTYTVTNAGTLGSSLGWYDKAYLSTDGVLDDADQNLSGSYNRVGLAVGASYTQTVTFTSTAATAPGSYTMFINADGRGGGAPPPNTQDGAVGEGGA